MPFGEFNKLIEFLINIQEPQRQFLGEFERRRFVTVSRWVKKRKKDSIREQKKAIGQIKVELRIKRKKEKGQNERKMECE